MKKITFFLLLATAFLITSCEYNPGVSEAFTKYRFKDGVTNITVPGWAIHLAAKLGELEANERELLECIDKVRVLAIENDEINVRLNLDEEFSKNINHKNNFETLMTIKDAVSDVTIFANMNDNVIHEMVVLIGGDENALVYIKGRIDPELIDKSLKLNHREKIFSLNL